MTGPTQGGAGEQDAAPHGSDSAALEALAQTFRTAGWVRVPGAVSARDVAELRDALAGRAHGDGEGARHERPPDGGVWQVLSPHTHAPVVLRVLRQLAPIAAACLGVPTLRLLQDALVAKSPHGGGEIPWHQDHAYTSWLEPPHSLSIRVALTDEREDSGGLRVLDQSHGWPLRVGQDLGALTLSDTPYTHAVAQRGAAAVGAAERQVRLRPGDVSLHHSRLIHGSGVNISAAERRTLVAHVVDGRARLADPASPMAAYVEPDGALSPDRFPLLVGDAVS